MSNFFLIISPYHSFDKGTLVLVEKDKLTEVDSNKSVEFDNDISKDWIEINPEFISDLKKIDKDKRLDINDHLNKNFLSKATEDPSNLIPSNTYTFLRRDSTFDDSRFKDYDANIRNQLVKIQGINNVYGHKTKYYTEKNRRYAAITLLHGSINEVKTLYPESHFDNHDYNNGDFDLMVDEEFIKFVKNNLILKKNSSFIDKNYINLESLENCECGRFSINDYVKIKIERMVGKVVCCVKINGQHCLKFNSCSPGMVDDTSEDIYIREEDVTRKGLTELIKYFEGVVVDPISILKSEIFEFEEFKVNDLVAVTLRDSGRIYESKIVWLGKVNDINVAAVKSITNLKSSSLKNFMWDGKFKDKTYNVKNSYLLSLSSIRKIPPESIISQSRIEAIAQSLKNNKITDQVCDELIYMHKNVSSFSFPLDCFDQILKLSTIILKNLNRGFIPKILENLAVIEDYDKLLVKCSITVLNIICDLCIDNIDKISSNAPLMEVLENIFNKLNCNLDFSNDIKEIFSNIMFIFWNINKNGLQMRDEFSRIFTIFQRNNLDPNIKLAAALNIAFLLNDQSCDVSMVVKYLIERNRGSLSKERNQRFNKSDISSGLGKIFEFGACYDKSGNTSVRSHLEKLATVSKDDPIISSDDIYGTLYEEDHFKNNTKLTSIEYEKCISIFVNKDDTRESLFYLLNNLAIMNDKECIQKFIKSQPPIELEESLKFLINIRHNNETLKALLENCIVTPKEYKNMINLANKLLIEKNNGNINLILIQIICPTDEDLDSELLSLAYTSFKYSEFELFTNILAKCKDVNSFMCNGDTFLTFVIKEKDIDEKSIIKAVEVGGFNINKKNKQNEAPSVLASTNQRKEVFTFFTSKEINVTDLYDHIQNYNSN